MAVDDVAAVIARARARGLILRWCRNCQHRMLPPNQRATDPDFVEVFATHGGYGLCRRCYSAARRPPKPPRPPAPLPEKRRRRDPLDGPLDAAALARDRRAVGLE